MLMSSRFYPVRSAALAITLFGVFFNFFLAVRISALWGSIKWDSESEWESSADPWRLNGVKIVGSLLSAYFAASAMVSSVGLIGIIKNKHSFIKFYRDSSIADFTFCSLFSLVGTYGAFRTGIRTGACEELSRHPELMRDMVEMGLNIENCELWFTRAVLAFMAFILILSVTRLHFLMAVSNYYSHLISHRLPLHTPKSTDSVRRIFLLPQSTTSRSSTQQRDDVLVYAPVPLSSLSHDLRSTATEAWISLDQSNSAAPSPHSHSHRHRHHGSSGRIALPIRADEGLLSEYDEHKVPT